MAAPKMPNPTATTTAAQQQPQPLYFDDQDVLNLDINDLYNNIIVPIDRIRSYLGSRPQESRVNAFYRMTGLPVVATDDSSKYYSPGYDPNLNLDQTGTQQNANIASIITSNSIFVSTQLDVRENNTQKFFAPIFAAGSLNATAVAIASPIVRSIAKQLTDGLVFPTIDKGQEQAIQARVDYLNTFYIDIKSQINNGDIASLVKSKHYLRPFIVDPRIASSVTPIANNICAPFLYSKAQTKIVDSPNGSPTFLKRPYIERVITTRITNALNSNNPNANASVGQTFINDLQQSINANKTITDQNLIKFANDLKGFYNAEINVFQRYFRLMRAVIEALHEAITDIGYIQNNMNFQPIPDKTIGPENGGTINDVNSNDGPRNIGTPPYKYHYEIDLIAAMTRKAVTQAQYDVGFSSTVTSDPGDFAFSNLDDTVFDGLKTVTRSYDDLITKVSNTRNTVGNQGIANLRTIEIIMGEFSGLGILDVLAIQTALWIMPLDSLVGLIDARAFARMQNGRSVPATQNSIAESLSDFDHSVSLMFKLIQQYFDGLSKGDRTLANQSQ